MYVQFVQQPRLLSLTGLIVWLRHRRHRGCQRVALIMLVAAAAALVAAHQAAACTNDSSCLAQPGGGAWQCVQAGAHTAGAPAASPCHINGRQRPRPDGGWDWPSAACTCRNSSCHAAPPSPAPAASGYGCTAGRCVEVEHNGTANSSGTCEWSTGCVPLRANEWIAASFEWHLNGTSLTCIHASTVLKKSQLASGSLPASQKMAVPVSDFQQNNNAKMVPGHRSTHRPARSNPVARNAWMWLQMGTVVELTAAPKSMPDTQYWLVTCASGSMCATVDAVASSTTSLARQEPTLRRLPNYLMIGDSISLGYLAGVQKQLASKFNVIHSAVRAACARPCTLYLMASIQTDL